MMTIRFMFLIMNILNTKHFEYFIVQKMGLITRTINNSSHRKIEKFDIGRKIHNSVIQLMEFLKKLEKLEIIKSKITVLSFFNA